MTLAADTAPPFPPARPVATRLAWPFLVVGLISAAFFIWGYFLQSDHELFFRAYLFAFMYFLGLALGGLCLVMLHNLTGGPWGNAPRVVGHAASLTLPLLTILFIPILFGLPALYPWARPSEVAASDVLQHRQVYLNVPFFIGRAVIYFAVWCVLALALSRLHGRWKATGDLRILYRIRGLSAGGLVIYLLTMTNAGVDWIMSRDIDFYSTAYGFILTTGQTLAALAFAIVMARFRPIRNSAVAPPPRFQRGILNDTGNVLLTIVITWTYVSFMQFLVIWMGNSGEDNTWYVQRGLSQESTWRWIALALVLGHFFIPFYVLLFRAAKQYVPALTAVAWLLLVSHVLEQYWMIAPTGHKAPVFNFNWLDVAAFVAVGGVWFTCFAWLLQRLASAPLFSPDSPPSDLGASSRG